MLCYSNGQIKTLPAFFRGKKQQTRLVDYD